MILGIGFYNKQTSSIERASETSLTSVSNTGSTIKRVDLSDGSVVWLKPNSKVEYPYEFGVNERQLKLSGEAFFVVEKDPSRPFMIISDKVITKVLGTSFNIRAYEESSSIEVEVLTGKVSVSLSDLEKTEELNRSVLLTPNQRVKYIKGENEFAKEAPEMDVKTLAIWQTTNISFDNVTVREVIKTLNDRFDVRIQAGNRNLLNCIIRADFTNQNLPDILELLSKSIDADYKLEGNTFILEGEGCSN
jgi:ferric-dicitrate binding protein FerR (iron transport regulator)